MPPASDTDSTDGTAVRRRILARIEHHRAELDSVATLIAAQLARDLRDRNLQQLFILQREADLKNALLRELEAVLPPGRSIAPDSSAESAPP